MNITSIDLGLMSNHLSKHEALINKFQNYLSYAGKNVLGEILIQQIAVMQNHVVAMLKLIDPSYQSGTITLPAVQPISITTVVNHFKDPNFKHIAIEARGTAQFMATDNMMSAMQMKTPAIKHTHINMALQQTQIAELYNQLITQMGWESPPNASMQDQLKTINQFQHIVREPITSYA